MRAAAAEVESPGWNQRECRTVLDSVGHMSHPRTHRHTGLVSAESREFFRNDLERPLLIVGNGPSAAAPRHDLLPDDPVVFRMNWFFLEDRYHYGRDVDGFFFAIPNPELERRVRYVSDHSWYRFRSVFSPMKLATGADGEGHRSELVGSGIPQFDHWNLIAEYPNLARFMMSRPLPTQGVQVIAMALAIGFTDITVCGVDMYESESERYGYTIPDDVAAALQVKDLLPGYESLHSLDRDLDFLDATLALHPEASVKYIGPSRHLSARLPAPTQRPNQCTFAGVPAAEVLAAPRPVFATDSDGSLTAIDSEGLPFALIDGKRCGYVTLVSGPFHHGARALARSLSKVSDVPLLVMCAPSAERSALRSSGISSIDVPEIRNPNVLHAATKRFAATYTKLNAFRMTHLDRCVYVDSDMIVRRSIDDLFETSGFCAVPDHGLTHEYDRFNSGLFAFDPDAALFDELVSKIGEVDSYDHGDQGFLNELFADWTALPHEYNVNKRWSAHHPNLFHHEQARVIHFVGIKPWQAEAPSAYDQLYREWFDHLSEAELIDLAIDLRHSVDVAGTTPRRYRWMKLIGARKSSTRRGWEEGSLLRRAQARLRDGAYAEALALLEAEWPGDQVASPGLARERAKAELLTGDFDTALQRLSDAAARHPGRQSIVSNLRALESISRVRSASPIPIPDDWVALVARFASRVSR